MSTTEAQVQQQAAGSALSDMGRVHRTLWRDAMRRLIANKLALAGGILVLLIALIAILAPVIAPHGYATPNYAAIGQAPTWVGAYPLGTDLLGRDVLSRMIYGAQVSMLVGLGAQVIVFLIGVPIGALSGYAAGTVDTALMRFVDVMYAFPQLLFVILLMSAFGGGLTNIFIAIGLTGWVTIARLTRAEFLSMRERDYIQSARAAGAGPWRLITRHMLPNALTPIIVTLTFGVPQAIFTEASLSFIGVGVNPPRPSWGQMVGQYFTNIQSYWYLAVFPAIAIAVVMMAFVFFGDGLRDALDPRMQRV
ncbi:MAG TPA: ABC transporter permease [Thermomicrobiaceae bacterium]|nr:ABC transporter permease [Thermomicrobiaceae bacterium]